MNKEKMNEAIKNIKSAALTAYARGNALMDKVAFLKSKPRHKKIVWVAVGLIACWVLHGMFFGGSGSGIVGQRLRADEKVGYKFLQAYLSGDFMKAAKYAETPETVSGDVQIMYNVLNNTTRDKSKEYIDKCKKDATAGMARLKEVVLSLGLKDCDIIMVENKGSYSGTEYSHKDTNICYKLINGDIERDVELHLQKSEDGVWKVVAHPFSFL